MILQPNEEELFTNSIRTFIITNYRVYRQHKGNFSEYSMTIFHKDIASIEKKFNSSIILVLLTLISICGFFYLLTNGNEKQSIVSLIFAFLFGVIWYLTRKHKLIITSHGGTKLKYIVSGNDEEIINSIDLISSMKQIQAVGKINMNSDSMNKKCKSCQHSVGIGDSFCENCGANL
jgi:hypothetical protein